MYALYLRNVNIEMFVGSPRLQNDVHAVLRARPARLAGAACCVLGRWSAVLPS